ncbi:phosphatase PAP2 family protein [Geojedonia litorea]|uniref:Phosphatase PAP2 family protein n=1 Tax=Geojedonia litorea TaxID=1268269 RepID=A0ABV9N2N9_9FLAO
MKKYVTGLLLLITSSVFAQELDSSNTNKRIWNYLKYDFNFTLKSVGNAFTQPLRWQNDDLLTAGGIIAGTSLLYLADNEAQDFFLRHEQDIPDAIKDFGWYFGSPQNFFIISSGVYGMGLITDNQNLRRTGVLIISSAVASGIMQSVSKTVVGRSRPKTGSHDEFNFFSKEPGFHSFPSGHAVLSFTMAHAIAKQFDNFWVKAGIYTVGAIPPVSRLWANAHWVSDVGLGMVLGIVVVDGIDNFMKKKVYYDHAKPKTVNWNLSFRHNTIGIVGTF